MINARLNETDWESVDTLANPIPEKIVGLNYRCPVCGGMVDPSSAEQILLHHEHATHPRDFFFAKAAVA